jgi:CDGSH-type Zn-finger protein
MLDAVWRPVPGGTGAGMENRSGERPETLITPYRDGPLLVRGPVRIQDQDGNEIRIEREIVALCRCGKSRSRPLCDGTHQLIGFRAPSGLEDGREPVPALGTNGLGRASNGHRQ